MPVAEDYMDDPPTEFDCKECGPTILTRCDVHPQDKGCYKEHLDKLHRFNN